MNPLDNAKTTTLKSKRSFHHNLSPINMIEKEIKKELIN